MKIDLEEVKMILASKRGAFPITITTETTPDLKGGKGCPLLKDGPVIKITHINGMANWLYENSVNRQLEREGQDKDFVAHARKWGARLSLPDRVLPFVHHIKGFKQPSHKNIQSIIDLPSADELYLELKCENVYDVKYIQNGKELDKLILEPYMRERDDEGRQGTDKPVILRDYKLTSVKRMKFDGQVYEAASSA